MGNFRIGAPAASEEKGCGDPSVARQAAHADLERQAGVASSSSSSTVTWRSVMRCGAAAGGDGCARALAVARTRRATRESSAGRIGTVDGSGRRAGDQAARRPCGRDAWRSCGDPFFATTLLTSGPYMAGGEAPTFINPARLVARPIYGRKGGAALLELARLVVKPIYGRKEARSPLARSCFTCCEVAVFHGQIVLHRDAHIWPEEAPLLARTVWNAQRAPLRSFQGRESADLLHPIIGPLRETLRSARGRAPSIQAPSLDHTLVCQNKYNWTSGRSPSTSDPGRRPRRRSAPRPRPQRRSAPRSDAGPTGSAQGTMPATFCCLPM
jgi:hypothetical protein